jgi:predicted peptidase
MKKLSSIQKQVQDTVETAIDKTEKTYISLAAKPFDLTNKFHSIHDQSVASLADTLRDLNKQAGKLSINLISRVEKEETKTEEAKRVVNTAKKKMGKVVSQKTAEAKDVVEATEKKVEEAIN